MLGCVSKYQLRGEQHAIPQGEMLKYMILSVSVVLDHGLIKPATFWGEKSPILRRLMRHKPRRTTQDEGEQNTKDPKVRSEQHVHQISDLEDQEQHLLRSWKAP